MTIHKIKGSSTEYSQGEIKAMIALFEAFEAKYGDAWNFLIDARGAFDVFVSKGEKLIWLAEFKKAEKDRTTQIRITYGELLATTQAGVPIWCYVEYHNKWRWVILKAGWMPKSIPETLTTLPPEKKTLIDFTQSRVSSMQGFRKGGLIPIHIDWKFWQILHSEEEAINELRRRLKEIEK